MKPTLAILALPAVSITILAASTDPETIWEIIEPSSNLTWTPCYGGKAECARFTVPLDYTSSTNGTMAIALAKLPSIYKPGDDAYRGPILINPGGPGLSGIDRLVDLGPIIQGITGNEYDIVAFDPRGIGRTTPALHSFLSLEEAGTVLIKTLDNPPIGSTPDALNRLYARYKSYAPVAEARLKDVAPYVNTPFVARDMLAITTASGFPKLKYWGFSYGATLGATFATMFPDKIDRMIIDGVQYAPDYYQGTWGASPRDADKAMEYFYDRCVEAGPSECAVYESTSSKVKARIERLFVSLKLQPIPITAGIEFGQYGVIDYGIVRRDIYEFLYSPFFYGGRNTSLLLAELEKGENSTGLAPFLPDIDASQCLSSNASLQGASSQLAMLAITCGDGDPSGYTLPAAQRWFENNKRESSFADATAVVVTCAGWKMRAAETLQGNKIGGNTSFPLLIIGNTADPATPLISARKTSKLFDGSVLLTVNTPGHGSLAAQSKCRDFAVKAYFRDGKLPSGGTVCDIQEKLFDNSTAQASNSTAIDASVQSALRSMAIRAKSSRSITIYP